MVDLQGKKKASHTMISQKEKRANLDSWNGKASRQEKVSVLFLVSLILYQTKEEKWANFFLSFLVCSLFSSSDFSPLGYACTFFQSIHFQKGEKRNKMRIPEVTKKGEQR